MSYTNDSGNSARLGKTKIINAEHSDGAEIKRRNVLYGLLNWTNKRKIKLDLFRERSGEVVVALIADNRAPEVDK